MAANPAAPTGATTGSPWEQAMMGRLNPSVNPEDIALRQRMFAAEAKRGTGPQFQGSGRPEWQQASAVEAVRRLGPAMGQPIGGSPDLGSAARAGGYYASRPGPMGYTWRTSPTTVEQPRWMSRG
jgi:hypothetical protein